MNKLNIKLKSAFISIIKILIMIFGLNSCMERFIEQSSKKNGTEKEKNPNIILLYADDLGWSDVGAYGAKYYKTPNIDRLAREGMLFTDAYSNAPNCAPSRGALYSGQYCGRTGMYSKGTAGKDDHRSLVPPENQSNLPLSKITFGKAMMYAGYQTVHFGKWDLGSGRDYWPDKRGFGKESFILDHPWRWAHFHYGPNGSEASNLLHKGKANNYLNIESRNRKPFSFLPRKVGTDIPKGTYLNDFLTQVGLNYIEKHQNDEKPFLLVLSYYLVHAPLIAPEEEIKQCEKRKPVGKDSNRVFCAMLSKLDKNIGRIIEKLDELGLSENTVVFFYSDNGGVGGYINTGIKGEDDDLPLEYTSNLPLRGGKTQLYEGGIRVPLIVKWPGKIKPGTRCQEPVSGLDLYPTFLDIARRKFDDIQSIRDYILDGESLLPLFESLGQAKLNRNFIAWHFPCYTVGPKRIEWRSTPMGAIRMDSYKLIEHFPGEKKPGDGSRIELYNLRKDIGEKNNLTDKMPEKASELYRELVKWRKKTGAEMPQKKEQESELYNDIQDYK
jgi:arylsulfatase A-like enzyme